MKLLTPSELDPLDKMWLINKPHAFVYINAEELVKVKLLILVVGMFKSKQNQNNAHGSTVVLFFF